MSDMPDLSSLFGMLNEKGIDINGLMQNLSTNSSTSSNLSEILNTAMSSNTKPASENTNQDTVNQEKQINCELSSHFKTNSSEGTNQNSENNPNSQTIDMETMMKLMKIMNSLNSNTSNPSANLLYSLKPFLRDSKKEKVDQYVNFLKISSILTEINKSGGDKK